MKGMRADGKGRRGYGQPVSYITERLLYSDFTDGLGTTGYVDLEKKLPDGALVLGWCVTVQEAFIPTSTAVLMIGTAADTDRFQGTTDTSVATLGRTVGGSVPTDNTGQASIIKAETTVRVTIEEDTDFTTLVTAAVGIIEFKLWYIDMT